MTPERYRQIGQLLHEAMELEPDQRAAFLAEACADDEGLRQEVESLLASNEQAAAFIAAPALAVAARELAEAPAPALIGQRIGSSCCRPASRRTPSECAALSKRRAPSRRSTTRIFSPFTRWGKLTGDTTSSPSSSTARQCARRSRTLALSSVTRSR